MQKKFQGLKFHNGLNRGTKTALSFSVLMVYLIVFS